jgi:hypothetical protein
VKSGKGKDTSRRLRPRPALIPLGEIFATGGPTATNPGKDFEHKHRRPQLTIQTTPQPVEHNGGSPSLAPKVGWWLDSMRSIRRSFKRPKVHNSEDNGDNSPSKGKEKVREDEEWIQVGDIQRSATYPRRQDEAGTNQAKKMRRMTDEPNTRVAFARGSKIKGPRAGQEYEMVNRKIIDTNPEKTVELSTWRVQNGKSVRPEDAERISIHYVSPEEVKEELGQNVHVEWRFAETDHGISVNQPLHPADVGKGERISFTVCSKLYLSICID